MSKSTGKWKRIQIKSIIGQQKSYISRSPHLQCTIMGRFPDCCCCLCTAAIMSIIPLPSAGIPISGHPWKWKWRTCCKCFSWWGAEIWGGFILFLEGGGDKILSNILVKLNFKSAKANILTLKNKSHLLTWFDCDNHVLAGRWAPCLWDWRSHNACLQSAPRCNLQMLHCPLMANTGSTFPEEKAEWNSINQHFFSINPLFLSIFQYRIKLTTPQDENKTMT